MLSSTAAYPWLSVLAYDDSQGLEQLHTVITAESTRRTVPTAR